MGKKGKREKGRMTCLGVTELVVVIIQLDGTNHLFGGDFGIDKTFGNGGRSKDSISVGNSWKGGHTEIRLDGEWESS